MVVKINHRDNINMTKLDDFIQVPKYRKVFHSHHFKINIHVTLINRLKNGISAYITCMAEFRFSITYVSRLFQSKPINKPL